MANFDTLKQGNTYTLAKTNYDNLGEQASIKDAWSSLSKGGELGYKLGGALDLMTGNTGSFQLAGWVAGVVGGIIADAFGFGVNDAKNEFQNTVFNARTEYGTKAANALRERNRLIALSKANMKNARRDYDTMFGEGTFAKLEETIMGTLGLQNNTVLSQVIASMQTDNVVGNLASRVVSSEYGEGMYSQEDFEKLLEASFSLKDLGAAYTDYLYEVYTSTDSEFGDQAKSISDALTTQMADIDFQAENVQTQMAEQFASAFFNKKLSDIESAQQLGSTQADESASGFRSDKNSTNQTKLQKYKQELANASYAITQNYMRQQLLQSVTSLERTRAQSFKDYQTSTTLLKRTMVRSVNEQTDKYLNDAKDDLTNIEDTGSASEVYGSQSLAAHEQIKNKNDADFEKIVTVNDATK